MQNKGFTLVELLITLTIAALLLAIAAPAFSGWTNKQRLRTAGYDLLNDLQMARNEAVKRATRVTLNNGDGDWQSGWEIFVDNNENGNRDSGEPLLLSRPAYADALTISGTTAVSQHIGYVASGETRQPGGGLLMGTLTLCASHTDKALEVVISRGGRARLVSTSRSAASC